MFKRPSVHYGRTPELVTPYQKAAQIWDERIGTARVQARNWRLMAFGCLLLSGGLAASLVWQSTKGTITPWVVEVDHLGQAQAVAPASPFYQPTDPQIAFHLARFVEDVRGLPTDAIVLRQNWLRAYDFTTDRGAAALNDYAHTNDPFAKLGNTQVAVEISSVIRASPESFRVAWTERRYDGGQLATTERWTAILSVVIETPREADRLRKIRSVSMSMPSTGRRSLVSEKARPEIGQSNLQWSAHSSGVAFCSRAFRLHDLQAATDQL